jgi:thiamine-phosphate pyrophosphorylase
LLDFTNKPSGQLRFIVNDRPDVAALLCASGVHVGQDDLPVEAARAIVGPDSWIGVSTHNLAQVRAANDTSANYIAFGPVFATSTKENPDPTVGLQLLTEARKLTHKPIVAIGGITLNRAAETYRAGADSLAVIRDIIQAADPVAQVRAFQQEAAAAGKR